MLKKTLFAIAAVSLLCVVPVHAEDLGLGWGESNASTDANTQSGVSGQAGDVQHTSARTDTNNFYNPVRVQNSVNAPVHYSYITNRQSALRPDQTVSSGTVIPGTHTAPGSLALMGEYGRGGELPNTETGSFVYRSGYDSRIYGGEGEFGPPPETTFDTIESGGLHLTTGHRSNLPTASGK